MQWRDNPITHQSLLPTLKRIKLCYKIRTEKISNQVCSDKSRGRVLGLILQVPQTTRFFFLTIGMNATDFYYKYSYASKFFHASLKNAIDNGAEIEGRKNSWM